MIKYLTVREIKKIFIYISDEIIRNERYLNELDTKIGDGDHGSAMSIGFTKVKEELEDNEFESINDVFKTIGFAMLKSMGGTSGVIFGTMFIGGLKSVEMRKILDLSLLISILSKALQGIKCRGKSKAGDKTMIDALEPAVEALKISESLGLDLLKGIEQATKSAKEGVEKTKEYVSKTGRAKAFGKEVIGFQDAGATSVWIIFNSFKKWMKDNENIIEGCE